MRILFIQGPYHPERCGITDYVSLLSEKLEAGGHMCQRANVDPKDRGSLKRIAENLPSCDWVSLQYAPYAFDHKGIPEEGLNLFAGALDGRHLHLLFHEIWIGAHPRAKWLERKRGRCQKKTILRFIKKSRPAVVHVTNAAASHFLKKENIHTEYLYLFGNVPIGTRKPRPMHHENSRVLLFFGTLYDDFPYEDLLPQLNDAFTEAKLSWEIRILGRQRAFGGLSRLLNSAAMHGISTGQSGPLSTQELSEEFRNADLAVSTTPYDALGKSIATAAMLEHGLPIIAFDDGDTPNESLFAPGPFAERIVLLNESNFAEKLVALLTQPRPALFDGVGNTARQFLQALACPKP